MAKTAQWTWLVYMAGDNNLEGAGKDDLAEMKQAGSTDDLNIIVQFDTEANKTTRYRIEKGKLKVLQEMPGVNCGDPKILTQFIDWGIQNYPAQHYLLDVWNHGGGWENLPADYNYDAIRSASPRDAARFKRLRRTLFRSSVDEIYQRPKSERAIAIDVHSQDYLDNQELRTAVSKALPKNQKLDVLGCDACLMNMVEVAYEMKDTADYMVGSEETEPGAGWPYDTILKGLLKKPAMSSRDLAKSISQTYGQYYAKSSEATTQSVLDLGKIEATAAAVSELADALIAALKKKTGRDKTIDAIILARQYTQKFAMPEYLDLGDFARNISLKLPRNAAVKAAAAKILESLDNPAKKALVIQNNTSGATMKKATGISIYFPEKKQYSPDYGDLLFNKTYHWNQFLITFFQQSNRLG
jgi:hypothetical protein